MRISINLLKKLNNLILIKYKMNNYEEIVGIKTRFENSNEEELVEYLNLFSKKWISRRVC